MKRISIKETDAIIQDKKGLPSWRLERIERFVLEKSAAARAAMARASWWSW